MLTRIWRGRTGRNTADWYEAFLKRTAYPNYGSVEGNRGWVLLRRETPSDIEFVLISFWDSAEALQRYTGPDTSRPKYYPEDSRALLDPLTPAENYATIDAQVRW